MPDLALPLRAVRDRVVRAAREAGRDPREIRILLAVKDRTPGTMIEALDDGAVLLGHNRVQELVASGPALQESGVKPHEMHLIGHVQSNKIAAALPWTTCVQSVDSARRAALLDRAALARLDAGDGIGPRAEQRPLDVMAQVNTSGEESKHGVTPSAAIDLLGEIASRPNLRLTGLMTIGANSPDEGVVRASYERLAQIREEAASQVPGLGGLELSMGMSRDLEPAIAAGATIVRVGTAVFGPRPAR
ncbi:Hypothetical protein YggS, proline synthase co-transcribed bacterial homolog PROSC [Actinomycetales bacterium JB111]|nr:Hypothetical protein YggS, proline synthase co-transcribed bacterial homolog PROSC [Actinomycetales bacterium JB111]